MITTSIYASDIINDNAIKHVFRECLKAAGLGLYVIRGIENVVNLTTVCDFMHCRLMDTQWNNTDYYMVSDLLTKIDDECREKFDHYALTEYQEMFGDDMADTIDDAIYKALRMTCDWIDIIKYRYVELSF